MVKFRGVIIYRNPVDLAEYVIKYYLPGNNTYDIDKVIKHLSSLSKQRQKQFLINWLLRLMEFVDPSGRRFNSANISEKHKRIK